MDNLQQTELQRQIELLKEQLSQAQKLTALGELASTTTHEFNNVLMTIINYAKLGLRHKDTATRDKAFDKILSAGARATKITNGVLGIARNRSSNQEPADLTHHSCVIHERGPDSARWRFSGPDGPIDVMVAGAFRSDNSDVVHRATLAGFGLAMLPEGQVVDDIRAARLYRMLADYPSGRTQAFVVYPSRRHLAPRTRVMIDALVDMGRRLEVWLADARVWGENETTWLV